MTRSPSDNHAKAPDTAAFVKGMRDAFGEAKVLCVEENDVTYGELSDWAKERDKRNAA